MLRTLLLLTAVPVLVGAGIAEGLWTNRWTSAAELESAAARLDGIPLNTGAWEGKALTLDEKQVARAGIRGYLMRRYVHRGTGRSLTVLLVCGRPGPVAVHTPDVCYRGAGYALTEAPVRKGLTAGALDPSPEFWSARFRKQGAAASEQLHIRWAWAATAAWQARRTLASPSPAARVSTRST